MAQPFETERNYILLLALTLPIAILIIRLFKSTFGTTLPPGPTPWPILGNIPHMLGSMPHVTLSNLAKIHGPLISLKLGTQLLVVGSSPDVAREFYKTKDRIFSGRHVLKSIPRTQSELNQTSLGWVEECTDNWKQLRTICRGALFSNTAMDSQASKAEKNVNDLVSFVKDREGAVFNIAELVFATVFNIMGNAFMSRNFIGLDEKNEDGGLRGVILEAMEDIAAPNLSDFYPVLSKLDLQGIRKKIDEFNLKMHSVWGPIVEERRSTEANSSGCQDFLDTLLGNDFTNNQINQLFTELFTAGTDTTASSVEWTMAELLRNPESMMKVREEIESAIQQDFTKKIHLMQLPFLGACIKETLRLHPPAPIGGLPHKALATCQVMNYTIPKNAQVLVNLWAIGRDPSIWEEPLLFKPERFLSSKIDFKGNDFEFLPFGGGRRICPGLPMAVRTITLILVSLIHSFDWSLPDGKHINEMDMQEKLSLTMKMEHPLSLILKTRI